MTLFALLHGGMHWGGSWQLVQAQLEAAGCSVVAPDLPVDDEAAGADAWAAAAIKAIDAKVGPSDRDVIVVGHSIAGLCLPVIAARRQVRELVFLSALVPAPGRPFAEYLADHPEVLPFVTKVSEVGEAVGFSWESVRDAFYHDCPEALARSAFKNLRRQSIAIFLERCPVADWPDVPTTSIVMKHDRVVSPGWSRRVAQGLLNARVLELDGGHSPFFANPSALSARLMGI